jgi:hypothetical protein
MDLADAMAHEARARDEDALDRHGPSLAAAAHRPRERLPEPGRRQVDGAAD